MSEPRRRWCRLCWVQVDDEHFENPEHTFGVNFPLSRWCPNAKRRTEHQWRHHSGAGDYTLTITAWDECETCGATRDMVSAEYIDPRPQGIARRVGDGPPKRWRGKRRRLVRAIAQWETADRAVRADLKEQERRDHRPGFTEAERLASIEGSR